MNHEELMDKRKYKLIKSLLLIYSSLDDQNKRSLVSLINNHDADVMIKTIEIIKQYESKKDRFILEHNLNHLGLE